MPGNSPLISKLRQMANPSPDGQKEVQRSASPEPGAERCDFCSKPIPPDHRHFADLKNMRFLCACEMCTILQAERGEYHPIPQRYQYLEDFDMPDQLWLQFNIPVNMAFFVYNTQREQPVAFYPAPAGATESELRLEAWENLLRRNPILENMQDDLEGFLVNRLDEEREYYIVPIDCCYELIGLIRTTWEGLHGGERMRSTVRKFFEELKQKSH